MKATICCYFEIDSAKNSSRSLSIKNKKLYNTNFYDLIIIVIYICICTKLKNGQI